MNKGINTEFMRIQCPVCGEWEKPQFYNTYKDMCVSCEEDEETEDMEHWIRADYNSSRGV